MNRFIADKVLNNTVIIHSEEEILHMTKTLRHQIGDEVEIFDKSGNEFLGQIRSMSKDEICINIIKKIEKKRELTTHITVFQGIPKSQKIELIIQKLTEIGVRQIVPVKMERCVKQIGEKEEKLLQRWKKIAQEASKQAKRLIIPEVLSSTSISEICNDNNFYDLKLICYEKEEAIQLKDILRSQPDIVTKVALLIGPEGGITEEEEAELRKSGFISITFGQRILRTETAAIYGASVIAYELE